MRNDRLEIASFRTIFEQSPIGIFVCDSNGADIYTNPANLRQMGLTIEEASGEGWRRAIHPDDRARVFDSFSEATAAGKIYEDECRYLRPDGSIVWVEVRVAAIRDSDALLGFIGTAVDITSRKQLEEKVKRSETMEAVGRMAGGIAHDFNNLLLVILGHAEMGAKRLDERERVLSSLSAITDAAEQAANLTRQLLTVAKHEVVRPEVLDLGPPLAGLQRLLQGAIRTGIELRFESDPSLHPVLVDPTQFQRLVLNLVMNAQRAIEGEGHITVRARNVDLRDPPETKGVEITVEDSGHGMDESTRARIFEPFFTGDVRSGTGLGLATCYAIVERAGGAIDVDTCMGKGSAFKIRIPAVSGGDVEAHTPGREPERSEPLSISGRCVLLVEDDAAVREALASGLREALFEVMAVDSVDEAVRVVSSYDGPIHLAICDVVLNDQFGLELQERLRASRPDLRYLFISGYAQDPAIRLGVARGEISFLSKPFSMATLVEHANRILSARACEAEQS